MADKFKARFTPINRAVQKGLAALFAVMGVLLSLAFLLMAPDLLTAERPLETIMNAAAAVGLCWLQWRYRHIVYPQLRRDYLAEKRA